MIVNVSPLEYGHILIVPDIDAFFPQILTQFAIKTALECMLLSSHRYDSQCESRKCSKLSIIVQGDIEIYVCINIIRVLLVHTNIGEIHSYFDRTYISFLVSGALRLGLTACVLLHLSIICTSMPTTWNTICLWTLV